MQGMVANRMVEIARREGLNADRNAIEHLVEAVGNDVRQVFFLVLTAASLCVCLYIYMYIYLYYFICVGMFMYVGGRVCVGGKRECDAIDHPVEAPWGERRAAGT